LDREFVAELRNRFHYAFEDTGYLGGRPDIELTELPLGGGFFRVADMEVETLRLPHGNVMTNAFRFGSFAYATDLKSFPDEAIAKWKGKVHTMVASGLRWSAHRTHSTIEETLGLFEKLGVVRGIVSHLSHEVEYDRDSKRMPKGVELAYDGMTISV
jgi:phosphoribosyl 1,2-cyclic phosphate phosphodiesterase